MNLSKGIFRLGIVASFILWLSAWAELQVIGIAEALILGGIIFGAVMVVAAVLAWIANGFIGG